jgi:hypothetical protein
LKRNARDTLIPQYAEFGFATAPVKIQNDSLAIRVVWIYPSVRTTPPYCYYEPVGLVTIPIREDFLNSAWIFRLAYYGRYASTFEKLFPAETVQDPKTMFSDIGISEIETVLRSRRTGGHPRTMQIKRRMRIISELPELWHDPKRIVCLLRDCGLYSEKTPMEQQVYAVEQVIQRLRSKT